jgi:putative restriction endonuclease
VDVLDRDRVIHLRVYVRNITHGGRTRRADEYRIQLTDERIQLPASRVTLLLGYHLRTDTFVAFDPDEHQRYGSSPSVQVSLGLLEAARQEGVLASTRTRRDGEEAVIAVAGDFLGEHVRSRADVEAIASDILPSAARDQVLTGVSEADMEIPADVPFERRRALRQISTAVRDRRFSHRVRRAYGGNCAFCGINARFVEGAHILPVARDGTDEIQNGLALCPTHHRAFDEHVIHVLPDLSIRLDERALARRGATRGDVEQLMRGVQERVRVPESESERPSDVYLRARLEGMQRIV